MMISVSVGFWAWALKKKAKAVVKNKVVSHFCVRYCLMVNRLFCCYFKYIGRKVKQFSHSIPNMQEFSIFVPCSNNEYPDS